MSTLREVAAAAEVSVCTASKVLSEHPDQRRYAAETVERIRRCAERLGYRADVRGRALRTQRSDTIALLGVTGSNPLAAAALAAMSQALAGTGLGGLLVPGRSWREQIAAALEFHAAGRCDGLLLLGWGLRPAQLAPLRAAGIPAVLIEGDAGSILPSVATDHLAGCRLAAEALWALGHRHLAWIGPARGHADGQRRYRRVQAACREHSCSLDRVEVAMGGEPADEQAATATAIERYLDRDGAARATGLLCYHDQMALVTQALCLRRGIAVPGGCSIVGHDDCLAPYALPPLSSVGFGFEASAERATDLLRRWLGGETPPARPILIPPCLQLRASTGPAPAI